MKKILLISIECLFLFGCGIDITGGMPMHEKIWADTTTTHTSLRFRFKWENDSLVYSCVNFTHYYRVTDDAYVQRYVGTARYTLESNLDDENLLTTDRCLSDGNPVLSKLMNAIDSSYHLKFSLVDSMGIIKSYDIDLSSAIPHNEVKYYSFRDDSIDVFLPEGDNYLYYYGSCYNGIDHFDDDITNKLGPLPYYYGYIYPEDGRCYKIKDSTAPQTFTQEIAALYNMRFEIHLKIKDESSLKTDNFDFFWFYDL